MNRAIIKQSKTNSKQIFRREREREREREDNTLLHRDKDLSMSQLFFIFFTNLSLMTNTATCGFSQALLMLQGGFSQFVGRLLLLRLTFLSHLRPLSHWWMGQIEFSSQGKVAYPRDFIICVIVRMFCR